MFDYSKYFYFYQVTPTAGEWSFLSYADKEGNTYKALASVNPDGSKRPFEVKFSRRERIYRGSKTQKVWVEVNGEKPKQILLYDYIKNYPDCEGSKNYRGTTIFKEMDEVKDAKIGVDKKKRRLDAGNIVMNMKPEERAAFAPLIGVFTDNPDIHLHRLLEFADNDPEKFFEMYESPDKEVRSLVRKAVQGQILKTRSGTIIWDKDWVAADEDEAVQMLLKDGERLKSLKSMVKKLK